MIVRFVEFCLQDYTGNCFVRFCYEDGKPTIVSVFIGEETDARYIHNNRNGRMKACVTHACELAAHALGKPPRTEHAKQRRAKAKPDLKVFTTE